MRITIEGKKVAIEDGSTILQAAEQAGVYVPTLCHDKRLRPYGSCRMCLVEVEGSKKLMTACSTPAVDGMVVTVDTPRLNDIRRSILELLLIHHPLDCPVCDAAGACQLQDLVFRFGVRDARFQDKRKDEPPVLNSPLIERDLNRCVFCGRCVRVCDEVKGVRAIGYSGRGFAASIGTAFGVPMDCEFCGNCVAACPVGALSSKPFKHRARPFFLKRALSVCNYCGTGCRIYLDHTDPEKHPFLEGKLHRTRPDIEDELTDGSFCGRAAFGYEFVHSPDRLRRPQVRNRGKLAAADWGSALEKAAGGLRRAASSHGPGAVAALVSPQASNEESFLLARLLQAGLGGGKLSSPAGIGELSWRQVAGETFGGMPAAEATDILEADMVLVIGCDLTESHPVLGIKVLQAARYRGADLVYASARRTKLSHYAAIDLRLKPGSEDVLMSYLAARQLKGKGKLKGVIGLGALKSSREAASSRAAAATGLGAAQLEDLAGRLVASERPVLVISRLAHESHKGRSYLQAAANLAAVLAGVRDGRPRVIFASEFCNSRGVLEMGAADGLTPQGLLQGIEQGRIKALYLLGLDPAAQLPEAGRWRRALRGLEFLVLHDIFPGECARAAQVVLPGVSWAEKEGSFTSFSGRVASYPAVLKPLGDGRAEWRVLDEIGEKLGVAGGYAGVADLRREIEKSLPGYFAGAKTPSFSLGMKRQMISTAEREHISKQEYRRLQPGDSYFSSRQGKRLQGGTLRPVAVAKPVEKAGGRYPLVLLSGNSLFQLGAGTGHSPGLAGLEDMPQVEMASRDAVRLRLCDGDKVEVVSRRGKVRGRLKISEGNAAGTVYVPAYYRGAAAAALMPLPDEKDRAPGCAVAVRKVR